MALNHTTVREPLDAALPSSPRPSGAEGARGPGQPTARHQITSVHPARGFADRMKQLPLLLGPRASRWLLLGMVAVLFLAGVELAVGLCIQLLLKSLDILQTDVKTVGFLQNLELTPLHFALLLTGAAILRALAQYTAWQSTYVAQESITARLRRVAVFDMLLRKGRQSVSAAKVSTMVGDYFSRASTSAFSGVNCLSALLQATCLFAFLIAVAWREAVSAAVALLIVGVTVRIGGKAANRVAGRVPEELAQLTAGIVRIARNQFLVRALRTHKSEHRALASNVDAYASHAIRAAHLGNTMGVVPPMVGVFLILGILLVGRTIFHTPSLILLSFLYLFMRFVQALSLSVQMFSTANQYSPQLFLSMDFLSEFSNDEVDLATGPLSAEPDRIEVLPDADGPPTIVLNDVSFRFDGTDSPVFSNISLEIPGGTQFAIVGPSGCGKSTLLSLILGVLSPTAGAVTLAGEGPLEFFARPRIRVGYVGAEAFLITGTLRENLLYGVGRPTTEAELWAALRQASLDEAVRGLPSQLEHRLEEDGAGLSAGQKQRLCLARALLNKPQVLILDEASANLDEATELEIAASLREMRGGCTTILVSHRAGILRFADETVRLG